MKNILLLLILLLLTSCVDSPVELNKLEHDLALTFVIRSNNNRQKALVTYVNSPGDKYSNFPKLVNDCEFYVNGIKFNINDSIDYSRFHNIGYFYNYYSDSLKTKDIDTFHLRVVKGNNIIVGKTIMPGEFNIIVSGRTIKWSKSSRAYYYSIKIENTSNNFIYKETTDGLFYTIANTDFIPGKYTIEICAFDKNYFDYYNNQKDPSGISGAYGIFGSVRCEKIVANIK